VMFLLLMNIIINNIPSMTSDRYVSPREKRQHVRAIKNKSPGDAGRAVGFVVGPDGKTEVSSYEYKRYLRIQRNNLRIKSLGLDKIKLTSSKKKVVVRFKKEKIEKGKIAVRRSSRKAKRLPIFDGSELENASVILFKKKKVKRERSYYENRKVKNFVRIVNDKERAALLNISKEEWIEDMEYFLAHVLGNSPTNVMRVMSKIKPLVNGKGVRHPFSGKWFKKGVELNLADDFATMHLEADDWVEENGGDLGHGWLICHPIKKIWRYQVARADQGGKPFMKCL